MPRRFLWPAAATRGYQAEQSSSVGAGALGYTRTRRSIRGCALSMNMKLGRRARTRIEMREQHGIETARHCLEASPLARLRAGRTRRCRTFRASSRPTLQLLPSSNAWRRRAAAYADESSCCFLMISLRRLMAIARSRTCAALRAATAPDVDMRSATTRARMDRVEGKGRARKK